MPPPAEAPRPRWPAGGSPGRRREGARLRPSWRLAWPLTAACAALSLGFVGSGRAAVVVDEDVQTMASRADVVVRVVVAGSVSVRDPRGRVVTWTPLRVLEGLKGARPGDLLWLAQPGGTVGDETTAVLGSPRLRAGQEVLLFADRHGEFLVLYALGLGVFEVERGPAGPRVRELVPTGTRVLTRGAAAGRVGATRTPTPRWSSSLEAFEDAVRLGAATARRP